MKIYVASSWRNEIQPQVVAALRAAGHEVYDFRHPAPSDDGFSWSEIDRDWKAWTPEAYVRGLEHPAAQRGFNFDMTALDGADATVLVLPCGRSAHLEAWYTAGQGKPVVILLDPTFEPELMYKMGRCTTTVKGVIDILAAIEEGWAPTKRYPPMAGGQDDTPQLPGLHEVRPEVAAMARLMEYQLRKHDDRPGWKEDVAASEAVEWARNEVPILSKEVTFFECLMSGSATPDEVAKVGFKAANVANYALMAADICGALKITAELADLPDGEYDIAGWCQLVIEGGGGMNVYEQRELATWPKGERVGAAEWTVRCLANPGCDGSAEVLSAIIRNRQQVMAMKGPTL